MARELVIGDHLQMGHGLAKDDLLLHEQLRHGRHVYASESRLDSALRTSQMAWALLRRVHAGTDATAMVAARSSWHATDGGPAMTTKADSGKQSGNQNPNTQTKRESDKR